MSQTVRVGTGLSGTCVDKRVSERQLAAEKWSDLDWEEPVEEPSDLDELLGDASMPEDLQEKAKTAAPHEDHARAQQVRTG